MFKIVPNPTFESTVKITVPGQAPVSLTLTFRYKGRTEILDWVECAKTIRGTTVLVEVIEGWKEVVGPDDAPLTYSEESLARLLNDFPDAGLEIFNTYISI